MLEVFPKSPEDIDDKLQTVQNMLIAGVDR